MYLTDCLGIFFLLQVQFMFVYSKKIKTWKILCKSRKSHATKIMENLLLSPDEQKIVLKCKNILESKFKVRICLPEYDPSCERDVVVANVLGGKINLVKVSIFFS